MATKQKAEISETKQTNLLLAHLCLAGEKDNLISKVQVLDRFSFADSDIALICNCNLQSVRDARSRGKKRK